MRVVVLRKGMKGEEVGDWQIFLRGLKLYFGEADNDFGQKTHDATILFQRKYKLKDDGVVGSNTWAKAISLGYAFDIEDELDDIHSPNYPSKPDFKPLTSNSEREAIFGKFQFVPAPTKDNPEGIKIIGDWASKNIVKVNLPALSKATGGKYSSMQWHKSAEHQLVKFFEALEKENLHTRIISYAGAFYPRYVRGSRSMLSNHSWGTAFDINVPQNGLNRQPALVGEKGCVREIVPIANDFGFYWGGHFKRQDGMHFEIAKII